MAITHKKTFSLRKEDAVKNWYLINAEGQTLGRLATRIAILLRGKNRVTYTTHVDSGDFVLVINADKIKVSGNNKATDKKYYKHSYYAGGLKEISLKDQLAKDSRKVVLHAVKGMLPKSNLARKQLTKCKVFKGAEHDHSAQKPVEVTL